MLESTCLSAIEPPRLALVPTPVLLALLRSHRKTQAEARPLAGPAYQDNSLVFATSIGTPVEPGNLLRSWRKIRTEAGMPALRIHDLRHAHATLMLSQGVHPRSSPNGWDMPRRTSRSTRTATSCPAFRRRPPRSSTASSRSPRPRPVSNLLAERDKAFVTRPDRAGFRAGTWWAVLDSNQ